MFALLCGLVAAAQLSWGEIENQGPSAQLYHAWGNQLYEQNEVVAAEIAWQRGLFLAPWSSELRNNLEVVEAEPLLIIHPHLLMPIFSILFTAYLFLVYAERKRERSFLVVAMLMVVLMIVPYLTLLNQGKVRASQTAYEAVSGQGSSLELEQGEVVQKIRHYGNETQVRRQGGEKVWMPSINYMPLVYFPFLEKNEQIR
ncbi:MAG: hypothetical protein CMK59_12230 [Proteobacteria bacterium]|nr:hypothetical protein [Pseudomonadota bacterium]